MRWPKEKSGGNKLQCRVRGLRITSRNGPQITRQEITEWTGGKNILLYEGNITPYLHF